MTDVTEILIDIERGEPAAAEELFPLVYEELRYLAAARMAEESPDQTLQPTALVHEAYLRLVDGEKISQWKSRSHFFRAAALAMRRILIDHARRKRSEKRGGDRRRTDLDNLAESGLPPNEDLLSISEALEKLAERDPEKAELVNLRFFGGFSVQEAAEILNISRATADRHWRYAKTWLFCELTRET